MKAWLDASLISLVSTNIKPDAIRLLQIVAIHNRWWHKVT